MQVITITWLGGNCGHQHRENWSAAKCLRYQREHGHPDARAEGPDPAYVEGLVPHVPAQKRPPPPSQAAAARAARQRARELRHKAVEHPTAVSIPRWDAEEIDGILGN